ncbi:MAG: hypothetical protein MUO76_08385 [Anaerolineaceae bacterium]|nr:hypothetical protein [Anaerolineaceae bacterium]
MTGNRRLDHGRSTAYPRLNLDSSGFTIEHAGTAFNAGRPIDHAGCALPGFKNTLRTNYTAHPAICA